MSESGSLEPGYGAGLEAELSSRLFLTRLITLAVCVCEYQGRWRARSALRDPKA